MALLMKQNAVIFMIICYRCIRWHMVAITWRKLSITTRIWSLHLLILKQLIEVCQWKTTSNKSSISIFSIKLEIFGLKNRDCLWIMNKWSSNRWIIWCGLFITAKIWAKLFVLEKAENSWFFLDRKWHIGNIRMLQLKDFCLFGQKHGLENCALIDKRLEFIVWLMGNKIN